MSLGLEHLTTERLVLRRWRESDREPFAALNADPVVMEHFASTIDTAASNSSVDRFDALWDEQGWGLWAIEVPGVADFVGFTGLMIPTFEAPFMPCVEIGWRLDKQHWGKGYAPEAASEVLACAFGPIGLAEVVSFTSTTNLASQRVMQKIGMTRDPAEDFDHPNVESGHVVERHVLYRIQAHP